MGDSEMNQNVDVTSTVHLKTFFVHGVLHVTIKDAKSLRDADIIGGLSDPYVAVYLDQTLLLKTSVRQNDLNPVWNEDFRKDVAQEAGVLVFRVMDKDLVGADFLGVARVNVEDLIAEKLVDDEYHLENKAGKRTDATLHLKIQFVSAESLSKTAELPDSYFPMHSGCRLTLFQDAHTPVSPLHADIALAGGATYVPDSAWEQLFQAISDAKHFIYIVGWAMNAETTLKRGTGRNETVKELLVGKASAGVQVMVMLWEKPFTEHNITGNCCCIASCFSNRLRGAGEVTRGPFEGTDVNVMLMSRHKDISSGPESWFLSTFYTQHQKCVVVDTVDPGGDSRRRVAAFVGGFDMAEGRWDTQEHPLYATLKTQHDGDFLNRVVEVSPSVGPRLPWHETYCKIEGPAAMDVYTNFVERVRKQASEQETRLVDLDENTFILRDPVPGEAAELWSAQLFRSINVDSAAFDPDRSSLLDKKEGLAVEASIHRAIVHNIRRADHFIYIENQYFIGSSPAWDKPETEVCHMIPLEIALRISQKIAEGSRFAVYIVIPMYPNTTPSGMIAQEMLYWQGKTISMMYRRIAKALEQHGAEGSPTDYLNFYCLGKRELEVPKDLAKPKSGIEKRLRKTRRFLIYVHSKMMVTDDEYIIVGSANINQRSMDGNRDTEMAVGALQTEYTVEKCGGLPKGRVHGFRMALWGEHMAQIDQTFLDPASLECVQRVNEIATSNRDLFHPDKPCTMEGHLLKYPLQVDQDGTVKTLPGWEYFPDTDKARVLGRDSKLLPNKLTT